MEFIVSAVTDMGLIKKVNQDSYNVRVYNTKQGKMVLAVLCDGMGGLSKGEIASSSLVNAFCKWADNKLCILADERICDEDICEDWLSIVDEFNDKFKDYADLHNISMGTTLTAMLLTEDKYYIINVGDSRAYEISNDVQLLTKDHTLVAQEVALGHITEEEAEKDSRRNILLQCIGASIEVCPDIFIGEVKKNTVYMVCSDGFRHLITSDEILMYLNPNVMSSGEKMSANMTYLVELNKLRKERDNISVISVRTF